MLHIVFQGNKLAIVISFEGNERERKISKLPQLWLHNQFEQHIQTYPLFLTLFSSPYSIGYNDQMLRINKN